MKTTVSVLRRIYGWLTRPWKILFRKMTSPWRKLPDFIIIGAQKSGTSSLFFYLAQHPALELAAQKEIHYFDWNLQKGLNWYKGFFPLKTSNKKTGEASPYYLFSKHAPEEMKKVLPDINLIVLLRNPIDRAYSQYHMNVKQLNIPDFPSFQELISPDRELPVEARRDYLPRGVYADHIKNWFKYFERDQFLFIKSEDFFEDPCKTLTKIYEFLGIEVIHPQNLMAKEVGTYPQISPATRAALEHYYEKPNQQLVELLGDQFRW